MALFLQPIVLFHFLCLVSASYDDAYRLESAIFTNYSTHIRPVQNFSQPISVSYFFHLVTIVGVDAKHGKVSTIGAITVIWMDEKLQWDPSDYGGITQLHPYPKNIWRPRVQLINSLEDMDVFEDGYNPVTLKHTGEVTWSPGGLLTSLCILKLTQFPFDEHTCALVLRPIFLDSQEMFFNSMGVALQGYEDNGEWSLQQVSTAAVTVSSRFVNSSHIRVIMVIARRPIFFMVNFFVPVTLLSILNLLTFVLVVDDGSVNIGYSMSILLAYTIYVSVLIDHIPAVSMNMPFVVYYIFFLFLISLFTTIDTIFIVWLNNKEEEEEKRQKSETKLMNALMKLLSLNKLKGKERLNSEKTHPPTPLQNKHMRSRTIIAAKVHPEYHTANNGGVSDVHAFSTLPSDAHFCDGDICQTNADSVRVVRDGYDSRDNNDSVGSTRPCRVNKYKNMSDKVRTYSLYLFTSINCVLVGMTLFLLLE